MTPRVRWEHCGGACISLLGRAVAEVRQRGDRFSMELLDTQAPWQGLAMHWSYHTSEKAAKRAAVIHARRIGVLTK
jgi:hypothetical protein